MTYIPGQVAFEPEQAPQAGASEPGMGEVFTRPWIVELILDLAGYVPTIDLSRKVAVEPACGRGAFVVLMVRRLIESCRIHSRNLVEARDAIHAYDLNEVNVKATRITVAELLAEAGLTDADAASLAEVWVREGDFLLDGAATVEGADFVLGNPPYVRLEDVPQWRMAAYRDSCKTMRGRSDVFVGFIECGLQLLRTGGVVGFIVADRWMRNQYGAAIRELISEHFAVDVVVQLHDVDAFEEQVSAYPAIVTVRRAEQGPAILADTSAAFGPSDASALATWATSSEPELSLGGVRAARVPTWFRGSASWPTGTPDELAVIAELEARFPSIDDPANGCRVGIGVATGADAVYLTRDADAVESDRLLPLAMAGDTAGGSVSWSGTYLVSPWHDGKLVSLADYPRLAQYYTKNRSKINARHIAQRNPGAWYRTIDRVEPGLRERPKLLFPDMKAAMNPVLDRGDYYPHHNLYFVTSTAWDLEVLGGLLLSDVANLLVGAYCVKMRGGTFRFQAQYVRRIRIPPFDALTKADQHALAEAFSSRDVERATGVALRIYGLSELPSRDAAADAKPA